MLATEAVGGGSRQRRVGEGHLGVMLDSVNTVLQFYCAFFREWRISAGFSEKFATSIFTPPWGDEAARGHFCSKSACITLIQS